MHGSGGIFYRKSLRISILQLQVFIGVGAKIFWCIGFSGFLYCRAIPRLVAYTLAGKTTLLLSTMPNTQHHLTKLHLRRHRLVLDPWDESDFHFNFYTFKSHCIPANISYNLSCKESTLYIAVMKFGWATIHRDISDLHTTILRDWVIFLTTIILLQPWTTGLPSRHGTKEFHWH